MEPRLKCRFHFYFLDADMSIAKKDAQITEHPFLLLLLII